MTESPGAGFWVIKGDRTYLCGHCHLRLHAYTPEDNLYWARSIGTCECCNTVIHHTCRREFNAVYGQVIDKDWIQRYTRPVVCSFGDPREGVYD